MLANLGPVTVNVNCFINLFALRHPIAAVAAVTLASEGQESNLDPTALTGAGQEITIPAASASLIHLRRALN